jgi:hypothetical protein
MEADYDYVQPDPRPMRVERRGEYNLYYAPDGTCIAAHPVGFDEAIRGKEEANARR